MQVSEIGYGHASNYVKSLADAITDAEENGVATAIEVYSEFIKVKKRRALSLPFLFYNNTMPSWHESKISIPFSFRFFKHSCE